MTKTILVIGADGKQGGSVINCILENKDLDYKIRGFTRHVECDRCKQLQERGVELCQGDITNEESIKKACHGVDTVFLVTNPYDSSQAGIKELEVGKHFIDLANECGVNHFIFSALVDAKGESNGKIELDFFTNKGLLMEYAKAKPRWLCSFVACAFYYQNFLPGQMAHGLWTREGDQIVFNWPGSDKSVITMCDVTDIGHLVVAQLKEPETYRNKLAGLCGSSLPIHDMLREFEEVTGLKARYQSVSSEDSPVGELARWFEKHGFYGNNTDEIVELGRKAYPHQKTWKQWLNETGFRGPVQEA